MIPISAIKKDGLELLLNKVVANLPEGPQYFPPDQVTDQPERFVAAELIREQVLVLTQQEVPYASSVIIEQFEESEKLVKIAAVIYVERDGQKAIVDRRQGAMLKEIGTRARHAIERLLGKKVFLELFIKVRSRWRESRQFVDELDWRKQLHLLPPAIQTRPNSAVGVDEPTRKKPITKVAHSGAAGALAWGRIGKHASLAANLQFLPLST